MRIDLRTLGSKLAKYRGQLKESIVEVASSTGIDAFRLASIETGQAEPTSDEVLILADHYRCDFKFFISNEKVAPIERTETLYRPHGGDLTQEDRRPGRRTGADRPARFEAASGGWHRGGVQAAG